MNAAEIRMLFEPIIAITCYEAGWVGEIPRLEKRGWFWTVRTSSYWKMVAIINDDIQMSFENIVKITREVIRHEQSHRADAEPTEGDA